KSPGVVGGRRIWRRGVLWIRESRSGGIRSCGRRRTRVQQIRILNIETGSKVAFGATPAPAFCSIQC
ncbi:MAG: hypothetical protein K1X79_14415, partial [Oligoflexia bacterium]|nr:hypothetical protein [Oligoflexia bacterium]